MILTEYGLHFARDGDRWRCVEWPDLVMLRGERYEVERLEFDALAGAVADVVRDSEFQNPVPGLNPSRTP